MMKHQLSNLQQRKKHLKKKILQKMRKNSLICVGAIGRPKGLKGEFFLNSFCSPAENIIDYIENIIINDKELKLQYIKKNNSKFGHLRNEHGAPR